MIWSVTFILATFWTFSQNDEMKVHATVATGKPKFCSPILQQFTRVFLDSFKRRQVGTGYRYPVVSSATEGLAAALDARFRDVADTGTEAKGIGNSGCSVEWAVNILDTRSQDSGSFGSDLCVVKDGLDFAIVQAYPFDDNVQTNPTCMVYWQ